MSSLTGISCRNLFVINFAYKLKGEAVTCILSTMIKSWSAVPNSLSVFKKKSLVHVCFSTF